jgi:branched-chain amino acid aminotransferase
MISEASGQNVFVVSNGAIHTSPINGTLLPGITRDAIITIAREQGIPVIEQAVPREMLYVADEVFLTGTATEVAPVRSVDKITVGSGKRGAITQQIQQKFLDVVHGRVEDAHGWLTYVKAERASGRR